MKREIIFGVVVAGLLGATVQAGAATNCTFGVKGGVGMANLGGADADSFATDSRNGFVGGLFLQADMSKSFGVRLEGLYNMKGASDSESGVDATIKLDYIEFPILLVGQMPASETVTLSAFAGPTLGFNINSEVEVSYLGVSGSADIEDVAGFEFGLAFGAGADFDMGSWSIVFDARYALGLTTIDSSSDNADVKNQQWVIMAGVGLPVGGSK